MARERALGEKRRLALIRGPAAVHRVFQLRRVEQLFEFVDVLSYK
jgi:hypothetical protein